MLDKPPPDVPSSVVVRVQFLLAGQALELVIITVVLARDPAIGVITPLARIPGCIVSTRRPCSSGLYSVYSCIVWNAQCWNFEVFEIRSRIWLNGLNAIAEQS